MGYNVGYIKNFFNLVKKISNYVLSSHHNKFLCDDPSILLSDRELNNK